jgi:mono/diheme cytochrome c family protein
MTVWCANNAHGKLPPGKLPARVSNGIGMIKKLVLAAIILGFLGGVLFWFLTEPQRLDPQLVASAGEGDAARGELVFWQGGCAACHAAPGAKDGERLKLAGGLVLKSPFGNFHAPNISMDLDDGIGAWGFIDFANAMQRGISPEGEHYYPAFPYTSYARMQLSDVADLWAFFKTLPEVQGKSPGHELPFPFNIRRSLGGWKLLFFKQGQAVEIADASDAVRRGQYLVEGPGHCGECHTARNLLGGPKMGQWLAGGANPEGQGSIPNITTGEGGVGEWSEKEIASVLADGITPSFDSLGGSMVQVVLNWSHVPQGDRAAVAAYLKAIPAHPNGYPAPATPK